MRQMSVSTGNPSDTHLYAVARAAADDPRPLVVLTFTDCDPTGWKMPREIAHKLRALSDLYGFGLRFRFRVSH